MPEAEGRHLWEDSLTTRRSINVAGLEHSAPIPIASRIGNVIYSSGILGKEPGSGQFPQEGVSQVRLMFSNMNLVLAAAGATADDVIRTTVYIEQEGLRATANSEWLAIFHDEASRPARHIVVGALHGQIRAELEIVAVLNN